MVKPMPPRAFTAISPVAEKAKQSAEEKLRASAGEATAKAEVRREYCYEVSVRAKRIKKRPKQSRKATRRTLTQTVRDCVLLA